MATNPSLNINAPNVLFGLDSMSSNFLGLAKSNSSVTNASFCFSVASFGNGAEVICPLRLLKNSAPPPCTLTFSGLYNADMVILSGPT